MTSSPHPGALAFPLAARQAVADGDAFGFLHRGEYVRYSDGRDILAALLDAAGLADGVAWTACGGHEAAARLGLEDRWRDTPPDRVRPAAALALRDLGWRGDRGEYKTGAALRVALLGDAAH